MYISLRCHAGQMLFENSKLIYLQKFYKALFTQMYIKMLYLLPFKCLTKHIYIIKRELALKEK